MLPGNISQVLSKIMLVMTSNIYFNFCLPQKYTNHTGGKRRVNVFNKIVFSFGLGRAVAEPGIGLEGPGRTLGSQYISQKLGLDRA